VRGESVPDRQGKKHRESVAVYEEEDRYVDKKKKKKKPQSEHGLGTSASRTHSIYNNNNTLQYSVANRIQLSINNNLQQQLIAEWTHREPCSINYE